MSEPIEVETIDGAMLSLSVRMTRTRDFLKTMMTDNTIEVPPDKVLEIILHLTMNQISLMDSVQTLLAERKKDEDV